MKALKEEFKKELFKYLNPPSYWSESYINNKFHFINGLEKALKLIGVSDEELDLIISECQQKSK